MQVEVEHVKGSAKKKPPKGHDSWLDYWKSGSGQSVPSLCPDCKKTRKIECGGHVKFNSRQYIVPVCKSCNSKGGFFCVDVDKGLRVLAPR